MSKPQSPTERLAYEDDLRPLLERITRVYDIGELKDYSTIEVGYEDCNVKIETDRGRYLAKMFAKTRVQEEIDRYVDILQHVAEAGVRHPEIIPKLDGDIAHTESGVNLVLMRFIEGKTFFELDRVPGNEERRAILEQAAKINAIDYEPPYLFDSWAIPNIDNLFTQVKQYIQPNDLSLIEPVLTQYRAIPVHELPRSFVHGDLIKTNIIKGDDGKIYVVDFSAANYYPRVQELAVIAANLLHDENGTLSLEAKCAQVADEYSYFTELTESEREYLPAYALAGVAMEFLGAHQEKFINGNDNAETDYWLNLGRNGLRKALRGG